MKKEEEKTSRSLSDLNSKIIKVVEPNVIFFYAERLDYESSLELNAAICEVTNYVEKTNKTQTNLENYTDHIDLHIFCPGGLVSAAFSSANIIKSNSINIHTYIDGYAASGGTIISMAGHKRYMYKKSVALIHEPFGGFIGKASDFAIEKENADLEFARVLNYYSEIMDISKDAISELLKEERLLNATLCLKYGIVDKVLQN